MSLTDTTIRNAKPTDKPFKLYDGDGLYPQVMPSGGKWRRFKYRFADKEKLVSVGTYPEISLKAARARREAARTLVAEGVDPSENRRATKAARVERDANSFEVIASEWFGKFASTWVSSHGDRIVARFERDIFPKMGGRPIAEISAAELLTVSRHIEKRGALETAHRALGDCGRVFRYAVATGRAERDPSGDLRGALTPVRGEHFAAITEPSKVGALLRALNDYQGTQTVAAALRLAPLVFVRPGELRKALWAEIDLDAGEWRYHVTKTDSEHIVPLATQAIEILRDLHALTGHGLYVFPGARTNGRPMSDNAILAALRRMGIDKEEMSGHGFRAMARTILDEVLNVRVDLIEHQLAHTVRDANGRAYNRTAHLPERRKIMQQWADFLDSLKHCTSVIASRSLAA